MSWLLYFHITFGYTSSMVNLIAAVGALALAAQASARAVPANGLSNHVLHEKREVKLSQRWRRDSRLEPDAIVPVRIGLKQNNLDLGAERLMSISHPDSEHYGKHLSEEEVHDLFAPSDDTVNAVRDWLISSSIDARVIAHSDNKGWLAADIPAEDAESLFQMELYEFEHSDTVNSRALRSKGAVRIGCDSYHLPSHLREHIDYLTPGVRFSAPVKKRSRKRSEALKARSKPRGPSKRPNWGPPHHHWHMPPAAHNLSVDVQNCGVNITPPCWRALYGIPPGHINDSVNTLGIYEQGDYYAAEDLDLYFAAYAPWVPQGTRPTLHGIDGGYAPAPLNSSGVGGESDVDFDISFSLIYPQSITLYQVDDAYYAPREVALNNTFNTFLDALDGSYCNYTAYGITGDSPKIDPVYPDPHAGGYKGQLQCGVYKPTRVISASYGESEVDFPKNYAERQCNEFMKLGLQGHTIFFSSSDFGVGNAPDDPGVLGCISGFGQNGTIFNPDYPVGCPWVTAVGATQLYANQTVLDPESAMAVDLYEPGDSPVYHTFSSSGGFSNLFSSPSYQQAAISAWHEYHDPGYPTYVVNADLTNIGINGGRYNRAGRGYPDVSANGAYMNVFVGGNPYHEFGTSLASPIWASVMTMVNQQRTLAGKGPAGFINPVLYANPWAMNDIKNGSNGGCKSDGFAAVEGWDPVTGLGTPNYPKLVDLFLRLP